MNKSTHKLTYIFLPIAFTLGLACFSSPVAARKPHDFERDVQVGLQRFQADQESQQIQRHISNNEVDRAINDILEDQELATPVNLEINGDKSNHVVSQPTDRPSPDISNIGQPRSSEQIFADLNRMLNEVNVSDQGDQDLDSQLLNPPTPPATPPASNPNSYEREKSEQEKKRNVKGINSKSLNQNEIVSIIEV